MKEKNYAFIDSQNLNLAVRDQGWKIDWKKLYNHLSKKYLCTKVYMFIWYVEKNKDLYDFLEKIGYCIIFKPVLELSSWQTKWNVDAELVLQAMIDFTTYDKAVIITWDWDFSCLIRYLREQEKLRILIVPNVYKYSSFLKHEARWLIDSITNKKTKLQYEDK